MTRLLKIAARDYIAYVRTPGFWLSILLLPIGIGVFSLAPLLMTRSSPTPAISIVDLTGRDYASGIAKALGPPAPGARPIARLVAPPGAPFATAADATARLKPYLSPSAKLPDGGRLDALAVVHTVGGAVSLDFWSRNVADTSIEAAVRQALAETMRRARLENAGVDPRTLAAIEALAPQVTVYSSRAGGRASLRDRLPGLAGFGMGVLLWMVVFTGAGMLLNSVIEEKSSRILEVLLTSASVPEIMAGKILGVAAVTATVLGVWLGLAAAILCIAAPSVAGDLAILLFSKGTIAYLAIYFVLGYLMFATLYVTVGAFCETTREAQTLLGPMMIVLSLPMVFMSQAITHPDSPLLASLSWVPVFTPFMMAARAGSDPPLWQIMGTIALMIATTALELWVAVPAFKSGALASGRFEFRTFFASLARRTGE